MSSIHVLSRMAFGSLEFSPNSNGLDSNVISWQAGLATHTTICQLLPNTNCYPDWIHTTSGSCGVPLPPQSLPCSTTLYPIHGGSHRPSTVHLPLPLRHRRPRLHHSSHPFSPHDPLPLRPHQFPPRRPLHNLQALQARPLQALLNLQALRLTRRPPLHLHQRLRRLR